MTNCFKIKYHWFLIIGMLFLSNYCIGQSFLSVPDSLYRPNGRFFTVKLNPTSSIAEACTSQTIKLDIGALEYLPGSNGSLPAGIVITPATSGGKTILTISGIVNDGKQGSSLVMDIAMQFKPGTCDYVTQEIKATTINVGCTVVSDQTGSVIVTSRTPNKPELLIYNNSGISSPYCPRKILKYTFYVRNSGNSGFNLSNVKLNVELDKCVKVMDVYKGSTYESVNPVVTSESDKVNISITVPDLLLSPSPGYETYDVYFMYPCLNNNSSDCVSGIKYVSAYLTGNKRDCADTFTTQNKKVSSSHQISTSTTNCSGDLSCATGGSVGEVGNIEYINYGNNFTCPSSCLQNGMSFYFGFTIPPFLPSYPDRKIIVNIPQGINITNGYSFYSTPCGTQYDVKYIDAQGNKQATPFAGTLTRQVELTTTCTLSPPSSTFAINFVYDAQNPPLPGTELIFPYTYSSQGTVLLSKSYGATVQKCVPSISLSKQVRKATQQVYENNYSASAIPGELMTYRQEIYNYGTGDKNNLIVDPINPNLIYRGGFRYAFATYINTPTQFTFLEGEQKFNLDEFGEATVSTPAIGQSGGTVTISNFNFPCSTKRLYIEYDVMVKNNLTAGTEIKNLAKISGPEQYYGQPQTNTITVAAFTYVKSKMFVKCGLATEWNESGINVKNGEVVDFKMQFSNAGSTPVVLSELVNLRPQPGDLFEFGSNSRKSTLNINYNCDLPTVFTNGVATSSVDFQYALNSPTMDRNMLCPERTSGNPPNWIPSCDNANWLKATFPTNFTLLPGDYVDVIYKGSINGEVGTAFNSFAFKVGSCKILTANSNTLAIVNDNIGVGCNSCTLTNPYSADMKKLFENLMKNILTRKIKGETDAQINGSNPAELVALKPYITGGGGNKIYNFISTKNAQNKITSIKFSFAANSDNDVTFLEEKGVEYNPEVGAVDPSYLRIDPTFYSSSEQYLTTCRRTLDNNGVIISECNSKTQVKHIDFCPTRFCYPMIGEIKTGD